MALRNRQKQRHFFADLAQYYRRFDEALARVLGSRGVLALFCALVLTGAPAQLAMTQENTLHVAAGDAVELSMLDREELKAIFLGGRRHWGDGSRILLALPADQEQQQALLAAIVDRTPRQFWAHWRNLVFAGRGTMPKTFEEHTLLFTYLEKKVHAIALVTAVDQAATPVVELSAIKGDAL